MKTSSPLARNTFFGSPGWLAKPKNFKGIGVGATGTGIWYIGPSSFLATPGARGVGITGSGCDTKMFLPEPSYLICSVEASCCRCSVGSRLCGGRSFFPGVDEARCAAAAFTGVPSEPAVVTVVVEALVDEEGTT